MLLRNHGAVCCGESIEEAWYNLYHVVLACENQVQKLLLISFVETCFWVWILEKRNFETG